MLVSEVAEEGGRHKILAVSSGGGHWVQLLRLMPAFTGLEVVYVTVDILYREQVPEAKFYVINDATRWSKIGLIRLGIHLAWIIAKERPHAIVSTGAAPGFMAIVLGRLTGARTVWLDSIANLECLSMSGARVRHFADLWLTQWPHLAGPKGPHYAGSVL